MAQRGLIRFGNGPMVPMQGFQGVGGDDAMGGVYVRDSAIAMEKLALAQRMERLHEWSKSADVYQEILDKYQDRVVPTHTDELTQTVDRYASVTETVRESLCKWPQEGLLVYRGRYETIAQGLLSAAGNDGVDKLHEILAKYFPTEAAKTAGIRLMDLCFEEGDYAEVNQIGKELLEWHPDLVAERPMVIYRTALAAKLANQPQDVQRYETQLRNQFPQATGVIRGQQVVLADSLEKELASATVVRAESPDSWPMVGGNVERSQICMSLVKPGARLYNILVTRFNWDALQETADRDNREHASDEQRKKGIGLGIMPAVDKGELFYQDNTRIYALDLDSSVPLPQWVDTYPMQNGAFTPAWSPAPTPVPLGRQLCVTVTDKYVAAVMGLSDPLSSSDPLPGQDSHLVCLDRKSGKELWETSPHDFSDAQLALRELRMGGSPLIVGDNLYVIVHGMKGQFEDCYVVCYAAATGQLRWATFIANSNGDNLLEAGGIGSYLYSDAVSHLAYSAGRLFVITNLGAVASLDAYTGTIAWLNIYRTESAGGAMYSFPQRIIRQIPPEDDETPTAPWVYNPAVVQDGKVFVMPSDGHDLLVYDAASGDLVKRIWLTDLQEERDPNVPSTPDLPTTLLAVKGDMVYLAGERQVWQVPWQLIPHDASKVDSIPGYWRSTEGDQDPSAQDKADDDQLVEIRGRAFVTGDAVYVPTEKYLLRIQLASGLLDSANSTFPKNGWEAGKEGPGNVIATQDHLIVAGDENIAVYTDIAMAQAKLNREIAEAPASPDARLHYAEVMYAAAQPDAAQQRLEEGFELLGGTQSLRSGATRATGHSTMPSALHDVPRVAKVKPIESSGFSIWPRPRHFPPRSRSATAWRGRNTTGSATIAMPPRPLSFTRKFSASRPSAPCQCPTRTAMPRSQRGMSPTRRSRRLRERRTAYWRTASSRRPRPRSSRRPRRRKTPIGSWISLGSTPIRRWRATPCWRPRIVTNPAAMPAWQRKCSGKFWRDSKIRPSPRSWSRWPAITSSCRTISTSPFHGSSLPPSKTRPA